MLLFGAAMGATTVSAQSSDGEVAVSPTDVSLSQGESQTIAVTYERESNATPQGIEYTLTYDPAVISVSDQEQGSYLGGNALINNVSTPGEVEYAEVALDGDGTEATNGTIATITIEAASDVDDRATTTLEFTRAKASEGSTEFVITTTNGTVEAEIPTQTDDSADESSDSEETTDDESDSQGAPEEDSDSEETMDDTDNQDATDTENETTAGTELNDTDDTETSESTNTKQGANESSTDDTETTAGDTSGAVPGFDIKLTLISVLAITYVIGRKTH